MEGINGVWILEELRGGPGGEYDENISYTIMYNTCIEFSVNKNISKHHNILFSII